MCIGFRCALRLIAAGQCVQFLCLRNTDSILDNPWPQPFIASKNPFYGTTPADAAHRLCEWLTRAHERAADPAGAR